MFKKWPKIPRLENEIYHITEKIDGTNGCIIVQPYDSLNLSGSIFPLFINEEYTFCVFAQSRTRLITPEDDNFSFAKWVQNNAEQLIKDLGIGYHYGEWWGCGINRGYGLDHKRFSLFNPTKYSSICYNVPVLCSGNDLLATQDEALYMLERNGSYTIQIPNIIKPEGLVIYAEKAKCYWKIILDK